MSTAATLFENERKYQAAMSVALSMLKQGVISDEDYAEVERFFTEKYKPVFDAFLPVEPSLT